MTPIVTTNNAAHPPIVSSRITPSRRLDDGDVVEVGVAGASVEVGDGFEAVEASLWLVK